MSGIINVLGENSRVLGRQYLPDQNRPAYMACRNATQAITNDTNTVFVADTDSGTTNYSAAFDTDGGYDTSTGVWTPGVAGWYFVWARITLYANYDFMFRVGIGKNTMTTGEPWSWEQKNWNSYDSGTSEMPAAVSAVIYFDADDYSMIRIRKDGSGDYNTIGGRAWSGAYRLNVPASGQTLG